jgi:ABC-type transporter Mla subunit MlaD
MPNYQRKEIVPGLFVLGAVAVFALYAFRVGRWEMFNFLKGARLQCRSVFDEVKTLVVGAKVAVAGRRVGAVNRMAWTEQPYTAEDLEHLRRRFGTLPQGIQEGARRLVVQVDFELTDANLRLDPASALVFVQQDGLLGQHYLDLYPGYWPAEAEPPQVLAAGHPEPLLLRAQRAGGIEQLAATAGDAIASIDALARTLNTGVFSSENRDSLTAMLASMKDSAAELHKLLASDGALQAGTLQPLQKLLDSASAALGEVREHTLPKTEQLLDESRGSVQDFRTALAAVQKDLIALLDQLEGTLLDTRPGLADSVRRLRSTLWQAEMAIRKVRADPSLLLFGSSEQNLEAREMDTSGVRTDGRARIYQQRDERAGGK